MLNAHIRLRMQIGICNIIKCKLNAGQTANVLLCASYNYRMRNPISSSERAAQLVVVNYELYIMRLTTWVWCVCVCDEVATKINTANGDIQ